MYLNATTDVIRVNITTGSDIEALVSWGAADDGAPPAVTDFDTTVFASITGTGNTTLLAGVNNDILKVKRISLTNNHASQSTAIYCDYYDGTNAVVLAGSKCTLLAGESLLMAEDGLWLHYDSNGAIYPSIGNAASQAEMEGGTANDKYVTPQGVNWHPGACKAWGKHAVSGGVPQMTATWNVTSVTDSGVSRVTPVIAQDFSSANYSISAMAEAATTTYSATTTCLITVIRNATPTATQFTIDLLEIDIGQATDPAAWYWAAFGDQ